MSNVFVRCFWLRVALTWRGWRRFEACIVREATVDKLERPARPLDIFALDVLPRVGPHVLAMLVSLLGSLTWFMKRGRGFGKGCILDVLSCAPPLLDAADAASPEITGGGSLRLSRRYAPCVMK